MTRRCWMAAAIATAAEVLLFGCGSATIGVGQDSQRMMEQQTLTAAESVGTEETQTISEPASQTVEQSIAEKVDAAVLTHDRIMMSATLLDGWEYRIVEPEEIANDLIADQMELFWEEDPEVSVWLEHWKEPIGMCGTGVTIEEIQLQSGYQATMYTEINGGDCWGTIILNSEKASLDGVYAVEYSMPKSKWKKHKAEIMQILDSLTINESYGVTLSTTDVTPTGMKLHISQEELDLVEYGEEYHLEKKTSKNWEPLPYVLEEFGWKDLAYVVEKGESVEDEINWEWLYGALAPGEYRLSKDILISQEDGTMEKQQVFVPFTIE